MWIPKQFPLGLDGLMAPTEPDLICPVCNEVALYYERNVSTGSKTYRHKDGDFCVPR